MSSRYPQLSSSSSSKQPSGGAGAGSYAQWMSRSTSHHPEPLARHSSQHPPVPPPKPRNKNRASSSDEDRYPSAPTKYQQRSAGYQQGPGYQQGGYYQPPVVNQQPTPGQYQQGPWNQQGPQGFPQQQHYYTQDPGTSSNVVVVGQPNPVYDRSVFISHSGLPRRQTRVTCPNCRIIVMSQVEYNSTTRTHCLACCCWVAACGIPICFIPYVTPCCRQGSHFCPTCRAFLGTTAK